jgi:acetate---CoA ligase (ADP-forming)
MSRSAADLLFRPRSVVVYGASSDPDKLSGRPLDYLRRFGYAGELYALNLRRDEVQGIPAYDDITAVPGAVDLAIVVVPAGSAIDALSRCAYAGVKAAIVFASGFAEVGADGAEAQVAMTALSHETGMRILGPNCLGSFSAEHSAFATFSTAFDDDSARPDSPIALVTQSGAVGTFTYSAMTALGLGVRYFANTGNESDITVTELLTELVDAPDVAILLGHMEALPDLQAVGRLAAAAAAAGKPLVLLKAGRTSAGARAVGAHTASRPGDDSAFDDVLRRHGALRVFTMEEMADTALVFAAGRPAKGRRLTIVTQSGGAGALATDAAVESGLTVDLWSPEDRARIAPLLPYFGSTANPIDATGSMINDVSILARTLDVVGAHEDTDVVLIVLGNSDRSAPEIVATVTAAHAATDKPVVVAWTGGSGQPREALLAAGVPTYADPTRAVRAAARLVEHSLGVDTVLIV